MCISSYREYCQASGFRHSNWEGDCENPDLKVHKERGTFRENGRSYYYVTDLKELRRLAKQGNAYAKEALKDIEDG